MKKSPPTTLIPGLLAVLAVAAVATWVKWGLFTHLPLPLRLPGSDGLEQAGDVETVPLVGKLTTLDEKAPPPWEGSFSRFRGNRFDGIAHESVQLARSWPESGPKSLWSIDLGEGHAGPAIHRGRVYLLDYDREAERDVLRCFSFDDGTELWQFGYPVKIKRNHGMSRTVPAVDNQFVVGIGPKCHVFCLDSTTGKPYWLKDMRREFGATVPPWYNGQCPLVEKGRIILAPGGGALLIALDAKTGETLWESPNPRGWTMTHVSVIPMDLEGRRTYVYCGKGGVAGIDAEDGRLLWDTTDWKIGIATVPSPVVLPDNRIFLSGGYNAGAVMLRIEKNQQEVQQEGPPYRAKTVFRLKAKEFGSTQQTPIFFDGHLFGVRERDKQLVCLDLDGNEIWKSGARHKFGLGPYLVADRLIFLLNDEGHLTVAEMSTDRFRPLAGAQVLDGHDAWAPMALADGRLLLRDLTRMVCLDVSRDGVDAPQAKQTKTAEEAKEK